MKTPEQFRTKHQFLPIGEGNDGYFVIPLEPLEPELFAHCISSDGMGWEHVSVHIRNGNNLFTPTWDEMCFIKSLFWDKEDCVMQLHPPEDKYVNNHLHVLHLWKPIGITIPTPPSIMVGVKTKS